MVCDSVPDCVPVPLDTIQKEYSRIRLTRQKEKGAERMADIWRRDIDEESKSSNRILKLREFGICYLHLETS